MGEPASVEGHVPFRGFRTWYRVVGEGEAPGRSPVLVLHGGPGTGHDYLEPLVALAASGRRVVYYDQLGCGRSDHPHDPSLWSVGLFVEEVAAVRAALGLSRVHLLGQSWGGMLALEVALARHPGLVSLVLADSLASVPIWTAEMNRLRGELPAEVREVLARHEAAGTTGSPEYQEAVMVFYRRHLCRLDPFPGCVERTFANLAADPEVYNTLWGPSEFYATGRLKGWDVTPRLGEIRLPTLVLSGRFDEATPAIAEALRLGIAGSERVTFEESSHMPHVEETDRFLSVVGDFLARAEERAQAEAPRPGSRVGRAAGPGDDPRP